MNNRGQSVLSEYVMIFFVVIAALVAMTTLTQRGLEARIHDARNYMINAVNSACDANCLQATGNKISYEYEPYYAIMTANFQQNALGTNGATKGSSLSLGAKYIESTNENTNTKSSSTQLPPASAY